MSDDKLRKILNESQTIAVVGLSNNPAKASHGVGRYLLSQGFDLVPVNPNASEVLGLPTVPDLASIDRPVDVVQLFRPSAEVLPFVEQAVAIGAKVVWMQEGIHNAEAAAVGEQAGLQVVMDRCMMKEHYRLVGAQLDVD